MAVGASDPDVDRFLSGLDPRQAALIQELRDLVSRGAPTLDEVVNSGAWLTGYLFYETRESGMVFAIGETRSASVAFHAMPWYASPELRDAYGDDLAPFASGKSCFRFGADAVLPRRALVAVIAAAPRFLEMRARHPSAPQDAE
ncbi:MAG TPA: hypothetical protein VMV41_05535 [Cellulomonadaceae bacterium]|nr:hypothetical protein [Cellulomonadaceae bacterium]